MEPLVISQVVLSVLFSLSVLFQKKSAWFWWALWWAWWEDNSSFYWNKRWMQKFLHNISITLWVLMFGNALISVIY